MKKKLMIFLAAVLMIPTFVFAEEASLNFKETVEDEIKVLEEEVIPYYEGQEGYEEYVEEVKKDLEVLKSVDFSEYKPGGKDVVVYVFRGSTCSHCMDAITYFASIYDEYKDNFDLVSYETWENEDNKDLLGKVFKYFKVDTDKQGVPLIAIGKNHYVGFADSYKDGIVENITKYDAESYLDVVANIDDLVASSDAWIIVLFVSLVAIIVVGAVVARKKM